jgi:PKD repeat protein
MGDQPAPAAGEPAKKRGWLKAIFGSLAGVISGAVMMYLSPLVNNVIKPGKPVANFAVAHEGLSVTFHNRSSGGKSGWWDFGDGSPLEPLDPKQEIVTHLYAAPGNYTAKLSLRSLFGEESERTVNVQLEAPHRDPPVLTTLEAASISAGTYAPATFRVTAKSKNAELLVWNLGDDLPLQVETDSPDHQERLVTFDKPGGYVIKVAAVNGKQAVERNEVVWVNEPPTNSVAVILNVTDQATHVETLRALQTVCESFPPNSTEPVWQFERQLPARPGYEITTAQLQPVADQAARNVRVQVAPDRRSVRLTGELIRQTEGLLRRPLHTCLLVKVQLTQERRAPVSRPAVAMTSTVSVPGSVLLALPPLPDGWVDAQRQIHLELRDGDRPVWQESQLPRGVPVLIQNRRCTLTAVPLGNQVKVDLVEIKPGQTTAAK